MHEGNGEGQCQDGFPIKAFGNDGLSVRAVGLTECVGSSVNVKSRFLAKRLLEMTSTGLKLVARVPCVPGRIPRQRLLGMTSRTS